MVPFTSLAGPLSLDDTEVFAVARGYCARANLVTETTAVFFCKFVEKRVTEERESGLNVEYILISMPMFARLSRQNAEQDTGSIVPTSLGGKSTDG